MTEEEIQKLGRKWFECLQEIRILLTDPAWEGEEGAKACRRYFMAQESFLRQIVGLEAREILPEELVKRARKAQAKVDGILEKAYRRNAERQKAKEGK